jgi:hypothetical protein
MSIVLSPHCHHIPFPLLHLLGVSSMVWLSFYLTHLHWTLSLRLPYTTLYTCGPLQSWLITSALKMEKACFLEMLAFTNQSPWQFNPKEHHQNVPSVFYQSFAVTYQHQWLLTL